MRVRPDKWVLQFVSHAEAIMGMHTGRVLHLQARARAAALLGLALALASGGAFAAICRVAVDGDAGNPGVNRPGNPGDSLV